MKAIRKAAAITAAVMAAGAMSLSSFAASEESAYKVYAKAEAASVGDTVSVSINLDANGEQGVGSASFKLLFDPGELELQTDSVKAGSALDSWMGDINLTQADKGSVGFAYTTISKGVSGDATELLSLSFKVLKVNGALTLEEVDIAADDDDGTGLNDQLTVSGGVVKCSHKNTETNTEITDCEKGGKSVTICKDCGETVKTEDIAPAEHKVDKWTETKKATCTEEGEQEGVCTVCGKTVTQKLPKLEHQFGEWKVTKPATCTEKGVEERVCELCGVEKETREIDMIEHTIEWTVEKEASCTEAGVKKGVCSACGGEFTEEIPALGHDWGEWETVKEPTVDSEGLESRKCSRCGETEERSVAKLPETPETSDPVTTPPETPAETTAESSGTADPSATTAPTTTPGGSSSGNGSGSGNLPTGAAIAFVPLAAALAAVVIISKKRK